MSNNLLRDCHDCTMHKPDKIADESAKNAEVNQLSMKIREMCNQMMQQKEALNRGFKEEWAVLMQRTETEAASEITASSPTVETIGKCWVKLHKGKSSRPRVTYNVFFLKSHP